MKRGPEGWRDHDDDRLVFCLDEGNALLEGPAMAWSGDEPEMVLISGIKK